MKSSNGSFDHQNHILSARLQQWTSERHDTDSRAKRKKNWFSLLVTKIADWMLIHKSLVWVCVEDSSRLVLCPSGRSRSWPPEWARLLVLEGSGCERDSAGFLKPYYVVINMHLAKLPGNLTFWFHHQCWGQFGCLNRLFPPLSSSTCFHAFLFMFSSSVTSWSVSQSEPEHEPA